MSTISFFNDFAQDSLTEDELTVVSGGSENNDELQSVVEKELPGENTK